MRFGPPFALKLLILAGVTILAGLTAAFAVAFASYWNDGKSEPFERAVWLEPVEACTKSARGSMVDDLVENHLRVGMPMTQARKLLGPPDEATRGNWFYQVSTEYGGFLSTCVGLSLDISRGRLQRAIVTRDD